MSSMNLEDVFESELLAGLKSKFHIEDTRRLIIYLLTRYHVLNKKITKINIDDFMKFLLSELAVDSFNCLDGIMCRYRGSMHTMSFGYNNINSISNVYDSIMCDIYLKAVNDPNGAPMKVDEYINNVFEHVVKTAKLHIKPYRNSAYKDEILTLFKLKALNSWFGIDAPSDVPATEFFYQNYEKMQAIDTLYERYLHAENFNTTNVKSLSEAQVRDYLYSHLDLIEVGLRPVAKEYPTSEGRADIVARDIDDNIVIIEIKVENDKRLLWQCMYYPDEIRMRIASDKYVRMITVVPEYPDYLLSPLRKLGYVECFNYTIRASNGNIEKMSVEKIVDIPKENMRVAASEARKDIDALVDTFVYTKNRLMVEMEDEIDVADICDIAKSLVEIHYASHSENAIE